MESSINQAEQYGRRNSTPISGYINDDKLKDTVSVIMADVDVNDNEACHRIEKSNTRISR